ncbi:MAG: sulfurtransferase [Jatrophihabitans sp.]
MTIDASAVLVGAAGLAEELADPQQAPLLLDVRWALGLPPAYPDFLAGHVPGAQWLDLETVFAAKPSADRHGGRHPLPDPDRLQAALQAVGLDDGSAVVVYDAADSVPAARAWWALRWIGLTDVRVLNGGLAGWVRAGQPLESGAATVRLRGSVQVHPGAMPVLDAVAAARVAQAGVLLDARTAPRFRGETESIDPVAGHVPGARNLPAAALQDDGGALLDPVAVREALLARGVTAATEVGAYCGSGITAAHTVWAAASAGIEVHLYPGSWSDWTADPSRPVATGA